MVTDHLLPNPDDARRAQAAAADLLLARALQRARLTILWERAWPPLAALLVVAGLFLSVSWLGLWTQLPAYGRMIGLGVFAVLALAALYPFIFVRFPSSAEALRRIDRGTGIAHRPATAIADELAAGPEDQVSLALWRAHVDRAIRAARDLKAGIPRPLLPVRDPYAVRSLVLILTIATFFVAGGDRTKRIVAAFDWRGVAPSLNYRVDAWVTPPTYTGRPPVILAGLRPGEPVRVQGPVSAPAGSVVLIRATGVNTLDIAFKGGLTEEKKDDRPQGSAGTEERRYVLTDDGELTLKGLGEDLTWTFSALPDTPPTIAFLKDPEVQGRGAVLFTYRMEDDYGVVDAQAVLTRPTTNKAAAKAPRPLYGPPDVALVLPQARTRNGAGQTTKDMTDHPWGGVDVLVTLVARDEAGNEGRSESVEFRLPERAFNKLLARALVEQRRNLALDADARDQVLLALDALAMSPDRFSIEAGIYLGLRSIYWQLTRSRTDDALRDVVARLWQMALAVEDGDLSDVERELRAAQEALRQALERGASDEEIKRLTQELRAALDKFMQALAEQLRNNPQQNAQRMDQNTRTIRQQDLKSMIDRLEQLARSGAKDAAKKLLEELQSILENLQMARPGQQQGSDGDDDMMSALDELSDMIRKQQQLRDRTFREGQEQRRDRQRQQRGERQQGQQDMGELRQNQQALRDQLKKLLEEMRKRGMGQPGQDGQPQQGPGEQLGRAGDAMGDAEGQLGDGNADGAVDSQGRALEALRRGAQGLAQAMQDQGMGPGPGGPNGQPGRGQQRADQGTDPLGRPLRGRDYGDDYTVKVPGEIDVQRARRILEELRRRFGDTARPQLELEYIERLLRGF